MYCVYTKKEKTMNIKLEEKQQHLKMFKFISAHTKKKNQKFVRSGSKRENYKTNEGDEDLM